MADFSTTAYIYVGVYRGMGILWVYKMVSCANLTGPKHLIQNKKWLHFHSFVSRTSKSKDIITGEVALSDVDQTVLSIIPNPLAKEYHGTYVCT